VLAILGFLVLYGSPVTFFLHPDFSSFRRTAGHGHGIAASALQFGTVALLCYYAIRAPRVHWLFYPALGLVVAVTVFGGARLALAFIFFPILFVRHFAVRKIPLRTGLAVAVAGVVAFGLIGLARGQNRDTGGPRVLSPFAGIVRQSLTGVDGVSFSTRVFPVERRPAYGSDMPVAVLRFVPRSVWPAKPDYLAEDLSAQYLGAKGGVWYILTAPAWFWATMLWAGVILGMVAMGVLGRAIDRYFSGGVASGPAALVFSLAVVIFAQFMWAGDVSVLTGVIEWVVSIGLFFWLASLRPARTRQPAPATRSAAP
jgi:hypothetical protein